MRNLAAISLAAMLMVSSAPSFAATSPEGATQLKKQVEEAIAFPLTLGKNFGQGLTMTGPVEVATKSDYYEVKLPGLVVVVAPGLKLDIGTILLNVTPGNDGSLATTLAVPQSMRAIDDAGAALMELKIGSQRFSGTWQPELAAFTKLDAEYSGINISGAGDNNLKSTIDRISVYANLAKNSDDTWSGPYGMSGSGLKINVSSGISLDTSVGSFKADSSYDKINLKIRKTMQDNVSQTLEKAVSQGQPTPEQAGQMV